MWVVLEAIAEVIAGAIADTIVGIDCGGGLRGILVNAKFQGSILAILKDVGGSLDICDIYVGVMHKKALL